MAKISQLPVTICTFNEDVLIINHDGVTSQITISDLLKNSRVLKTGITPIGIIDGINRTFTITEEFITNSTIVYLDGIKQKRGDAYYEIDNNTIQFTDTILYGTSLDMDYLPLNM